jgi:N-acylneuraminate cytidylyltransferase
MDTGQPITTVALIPARAGSKRIAGKNMRMLHGKPLLQWTIDCAYASQLFQAIVVSSEDDRTLDYVSNQQLPGVLAYHRPDALATDSSPDIDWVRDVLVKLRVQDIRPDAFAILRPTSPFRTVAMLHRAAAQFDDTVSSLRAVEPVRQHPGKMWQLCYHGRRIQPLIGPQWPLPDGMVMRAGSTPRHSLPTQLLPPVYVQNGSLEWAWTWCVTNFGTISGPNVAPFFTEGYEGLDLNTPDDWIRAETLAPVLLAHVSVVPTAH